MVYSFDLKKKRKYFLQIISYNLKFYVKKCIIMIFNVLFLCFNLKLFEYYFDIISYFKYFG